MLRRKIIGVRLNVAEETILEDYCKEFSCKKSLVIRKAIEEYINKIRPIKKTD